MTNLEKYDHVFIEILGISEEELPSATYKETEQWDSVGHMSLIAAIEDDFNIMFDADDIMDFTNYKTGMEILQNHYNISFQE